MKSAAFSESNLFDPARLQKISGKPSQPFHILLWIQFQFNYSRLGNLTVSSVDSFVPNPAFMVARPQQAQPVLPLYSLFPCSVTTPSRGLGSV
jgi:hypothetical protein